jgi:hypothetical protein
MSLKYCPNICLEGPRDMKNIRKDSWSPGRDLNLEPSTYEAAALNIRDENNFKRKMST